MKVWVFYIFKWYNMLMKKLPIFVVLIVLIILAYFVFTNRKDKEIVLPISESSLTYINATNDLIRVELPYPEAVTGKEFSVVGSARGMWYFEASFPVDVLDKDGNILVQSYATAQGEWMTEDFVPFKGDIKIPSSYIGPATLVLHRSNASGLPENDAQVSFPFNIEY